MRRFIISSAMLALVVRSAALAAVPGAPAERQSPSGEPLRLGLRGMHFVPNHGQWADADVRFGLRSAGMDVALRESSISMHLKRLPYDAIEGPDAARPGSQARRSGRESLTLNVTFPGASAVLPKGTIAHGARAHYFVGGEGRESRSDLPTYEAVAYENLYAGIDLHVTGSETGVLKYEFRAAPGADLSQIRIALDGIDSLSVDDDGSLRIESPLGTLRDAAPVAWQERDGDRRTIQARFEVLDARTYCIALDGEVDPDLALVIDPDLEWMYFFGGSAGDEAFAMARDREGSLVVTGLTGSADFFGRGNEIHGALDTFVAKMRPDGELAWMTYLGGSNSEWGEGIATDSANSIRVTGHTGSPDFAGANNSFHGGSSDAFVVGLDPQGRLEWMTYLGGSASDTTIAITVDESGNTYVAGSSESADIDERLNSLQGLWDVIVARIDAGGIVRWARYLGGRDYDYGRGIAVGFVGDLIISGETKSLDFEGRNIPYQGGPWDGFVSRITTAGTLLWSTYLGGTDHDIAHALTLHVDGNAYVTGETKSRDFAQRTNSYLGGQWDVFVARIPSHGRSTWMTYVGGSGRDTGLAIASHAFGALAVGGWTRSPDFTHRNNAPRGVQDAFVATLSPGGLVSWSVYLGGSAGDYGRGIACDGQGAIYLAGMTESTNFEGRGNTYYGGIDDAFLLRIEGSGPQLAVGAQCPSGGAIRVEAYGATPDGGIAILYARNAGAFVIPKGNPCAGTRLGLGTSSLQVVFNGTANVAGSRVLNSTIDPSVCGGFLQMLDLTTCQTSNVAQIE